MHAGTRREVLHVHASRMSCLSESGPTGPIDPTGEEQAENGPLRWADSPDDPKNRPTKAAHFTRENLSAGPSGPNGPVSERYKTGTSTGPRKREVV